MADDSCARAVLAINTKSDVRKPILGYVGFTWHDFVNPDCGKVVQANVESSLGNHLLASVKSGAYQIPGVTIASRPAAAPVPVRKVSPPDVFKHTAIRGKTLPVKQAVLDQWNSVGDPQITAMFAEVIKNHNKVFNPEGTPWKCTRPSMVIESDTSLQEQEATTIAPKTGFESLDVLKARPTLCAMHVWHP